MEEFSLLGFGAVTERDSARFGWKAVRQALLSQNGFRVPEGFLLCLRDLDSAKAAYMKAVEQFPEVMGANAIMRSSAADEDGAMSYAGVYDSIVFDGRSVESFQDAARKLMASYTSEAAQTYARRNAAVLEENACLTSLVQRMLAPSCSGVAYTVDPVTGLNRVVIESTHGINSLLTDGKISPDYVQLNEHGRILTRRRGKKQRIVRVNEGHIAERAATAEESDVFSIADEQIHTLWVAAQQIQALAGKPQDIEWAFENGELYVLQNREISTLGW